MIQVYHATHTRSVRVIWLLEELGVPYEIRKVDFLGGEHQQSDYLARSPLGKLPAIEDGDVRMFESGAIVEYLCETYDRDHRLSPAPGSPKRPEFLQWLHWAEATAMPPIGDYFQNAMLKPEAERIPQVLPEALNRIARWLAVLEKHLAGRTYVLGDDFSAADCMLGYTVSGAKFSGQVDARFPNVDAYATRLADRPGFKKANAV